MKADKPKVAKQKWICGRCDTPVMYRGVPNYCPRCRSDQMKPFEKNRQLHPETTSGPGYKTR